MAFRLRYTAFSRRGLGLHDLVLLSAFTQQHIPAGGLGLAGFLLVLVGSCLSLGDQ